jgi:ceramide glucosyltransferase
VTAAAAALLWALVAASGLYWVVAWAAVRRLLRRAAPPGPAAALPAASILKPVRGLDEGAAESLATFLRQDHPRTEVLFGVDDPADPAVAVIERLRREHPAVRTRLVVAAPGGPNRKASLLDALAREARHDVLVAADADMRVAPDYLRRVLTVLAAPGVGLVTCPYRGEAPASVAARLEALHIGVTFLPSMAVAAELVRLPFAMGATIALGRAELDAIGGFAAVAGHLADDYEVGARVAALGRRVVVCPLVLATVLGAPRLRDVWQREVRWSRCARVSRPAGQLGYGITFTTPLALALLALTGGAPAGWIAIGGALALRWAVAAAVARETGDRASRAALPLLPVRDVLSAAVWAVGLVGRRVVWRGEAFDVVEGGRLRRRAPAPPPRRAAWRRRVATPAAPPRRAGPPAGARTPRPR